MPRRKKVKIVRKFKYIYHTDISATNPNVQQYSLNYDLSSLVLLCKLVYNDLKCIDNGLYKMMPFAGFLHTITTITQAAIIDLIQNDNKETRYLDEGDPRFYLNIDIPEPIAVYISFITKSILSSGDYLLANFPEIAIPTLQHRINDVDIPAGTFGIINAENHNVYECYVSPYVTRKYIEATLAQNKNWDPLPTSFFPDGTKPTENLLGYCEIETLDLEGINALSGLDFPSDNCQTIEARIQYSYKLTARFSVFMRLLRGKYKLRNALIPKEISMKKAGFIEVNENVNAATCIAPMNVTIASDEPIYNTLYITELHLFGMRRRRDKVAPGYCYVNADGSAIAGWKSTINNNFYMYAPFTPTIGQNFEKLQNEDHELIIPPISRVACIQEFLKLSLIDKQKD